ncbi:hypothetical protein E2C01_082770 [Portunus trituberculatus]|uniref:Uncharacterized protein n=1 Tax=Portunus trituberculatus TaxID=210409 RepID=A0A5B7IT73_PORTR|nr:hypothetical protein [Portunus trituberculatus]
MEVLQSSLGSLRAEAQDYTDRSCESVRGELEQNLQAVNGDLQTEKGELEKDLQALRDEFGANRIWQGAHGPTRGVLGAPWVGTGALLEQWTRGGLLEAHQRPPGLWETRVCWHQVPRHLPSLPRPAWRTLSLSPPPPPPRSPFPRFKSRKPAEYDGKVAWESYAAQFDLLAAAQGWDQAEKALQLATALRGPAIEVSGHLPPTQRASFPDIAEALRRHRAPPPG